QQDEGKQGGPRFRRRIALHLNQIQREKEENSTQRGVEWSFLLFPAEFDSGARLFSDGSGGRPASLHLVDVLAVALVWRTSRPIRRQDSAGGGSVARSRRIRAVCEARYWRSLLDNVLPRSAGAGARYGDQRCPADHDRNERCGAKLRG